MRLLKYLTGYFLLNTDFLSRFGVCCLFLVSASGSTINQNCTYLRNPDFPNPYTSTTALTYTINKSTAGITLPLHVYLLLFFIFDNRIGFLRFSKQVYHAFWGGYIKAKIQTNKYKNQSYTLLILMALSFFC